MMKWQRGGRAARGEGGRLWLLGLFCAVRLTSGIKARGPQVLLLSHRSCSINPSEECNKVFHEQLVAMSKNAAEGIPGITNQLLYNSLPAEIQHNPKWSRYVADGLRGRGYWFWKPAIVNMLLNQSKIRDGDTVIWLDGDVDPRRLASPGTWERALKSDFDWYVLGAEAAKCCDTLAKSCKCAERNWTKGDIFKHLSVGFDNPQYGPPQQIQGAFFIAKIDAKTRLVFQHWEELVSHWHLVSDEPSSFPDFEGFTENRHDQSLLSMLLKANMVHIDGADHSNQSLHPTYGVQGLRAFQGSLDGLTTWADRSSVSPKTTV